MIERQRTFDIMVFHPDISDIFFAKYLIHLLYKHGHS